MSILTSKQLSRTDFYTKVEDAKTDETIFFEQGVLFKHRLRGHFFKATSNITDSELKELCPGNKYMLLVKLK